MKHILPVFGVFLLISLSMPGSRAVVAEPAPGAFTQYLAGIELLGNDHRMDNKTKARRYRQLCALTGVDAGSAIKFLKRYGDKPAQWQKVQTSVVDALEALK
jgi:hypothetical protein